MFANPDKHSFSVKSPQSRHQMKRRVLGVFFATSVYRGIAEMDVFLIILDCLSRPTLVHGMLLEFHTIIILITLLSRLTHDLFIFW